MKKQPLLFNSGYRNNQVSILPNLELKLLRKLISADAIVFFLYENVCWDRWQNPLAEVGTAIVSIKAGERMNDCCERLLAFFGMYVFD